MMNDSIIELQTTAGICTKLEKLYVKRDGKFLYTYEDKACLSRDRKINMPLYYEIACYTSIRRSYKDLITEFFDELSFENIKGFFKSRESLKRAGRGCGRVGGEVAFCLGIYCLCRGQHPRNINVVHAPCAICRNDDPLVCGKKKICGKYYGCGNGVLSPLNSKFNINDIPIIRAKIRTENFLEP
jgi:hypothetical protein